MQYSKSILITLGHNSSVIYFGGLGEKPIGYEEERLSKRKSDSSYPKLALEKVISKVRGFELTNCNVFISHWFDNFEIESFPKKYFDLDHFLSIVDRYKLTVIPVSSEFTHHDAHAYSTLAFSENFPSPVNGTVHHIVVDGFGNNEEVVSIYEQATDVNGMQYLMPIHRVYGYENSLGLMYQYATSFTGMKENQDEYKFLGYESGITKILDTYQIASLTQRAVSFSMFFSKRCLEQYTQRPNARVVNSEIGIDTIKLMQVREKMYLEFQDVVNRYCKTPEANTIDGIRTVIGYYVQACLENCLFNILDKFKVENAYLSGGCFLNVKLNKFILDNISGTVCVNPLSGDQGAAIGLYRRYTKSHFNFSDLCFGVRDGIKFAEATIMLLQKEGIYVVRTDEGLVNVATDLLNSNYIVNIMRGNMEFGPRALCNTSTLAMPTAENTEYINRANNRNEVMPMAPVMINTAAKILLSSDLHRVKGSNKFMIITHDTSRMMTEHLSRYRGVMHNNPLNSDFTCRPQVVYDSSSVIHRILSNVNVPCLINTSFNTHGTPILYSFSDAIHDFRKQKLNDPDARLTLILQIHD